jgi:hypothetical protein
MSDLFALEAGKYLERLDALLAKGDAPSADELVRPRGSRPWRSEFERGVGDRARGPEGPDCRNFAQLLVKVMESGSDVVSIGSLYSDSGPHIVSRGVPAGRPSTLGRIELVSQGGHLRQAADSLERAPTATQRELRAHTLATTFRALANASGGRLADRVAQWRKVGDLLARSGAGDEDPLAAELDTLITTIRGMRPGVPSPAADAASVVPIELLAPAAPSMDEPVLDSADLVGSWAASERLAEASPGPASLDEVLVRAAGPGAGGSDSRAREPACPVAPAAAPAPDLPVADARTLLYCGEPALQRAQELRETAKRASGDDLRAIIDEVCDLVVLAIEPES